MVDRLCGKTILKYIVALLQCLIHIPGFYMCLSYDVAALVDRICILLDRLLHRHHDRKLFVFHLDQLHRFLGDLQGIRRYRRHTVPDKTNRIVEDSLRIRNLMLNKPQRAVEPGLRRILIGRNCTYARQTLCPAGIDTLDSRMCLGTEQDFRIQHARKLHITHIYFPSGNLRCSVTDGNSLPDLSELITFHLIHPAFFPPLK